MARFRLASVLRARLALEDMAQAEVVRARGAGRAARTAAARRENVLRESTLPTDASGRAVVAALVARQSLAAGLAAARQDVVVADEDTDARLAELAEAAKRRRIVERLAERHAAVQRARMDAADQRALDEIATSAATRRGASL